MAKILIVDDSKTSRKFLRNMLEDAGHEIVSEAVNGVEGVEKFRLYKPDVVTMDITMPVMDGLEATFLIRQFDENIPIIALTANAFDSDKEAAFAVGCNHFMTKPLKKKELMKLLSDFVEERTF